MPRDLTAHLDPGSTAIVTLEVQENLLLPGAAMIPVRPPTPRRSV